MTSPTYYTMTDTNSFWTPTIDDIVGSTRDFGASNAGKNPCNGPTEDPSNVTSVNEVLSSFVESTSSANQWTTNGLNLLTTPGVNTTEVTFGKFELAGFQHILIQCNATVLGLVMFNVSEVKFYKLKINTSCVRNDNTSSSSCFSRSRAFSLSCSSFIFLSSSSWRRALDTWYWACERRSRHLLDCKCSLC